MFVSEYDAFGPWIYEISEAHPLPPLFVPHFPQTPAPLFCFKIPREIERRVATPDMDLYDYVVGAYDDHILILKRDGKQVSASSVPYSAVQGIRLYRKFLVGTCTLYLDSGAAAIPFNTTSMDLMQRFVRLVRAHCQGGEHTGGKAAPAIDPVCRDEISDMLFVNLLNDLRDAGELFQIGAFQPAVPVTPKQTGFTRQLSSLLKPPSLPGALHLYNDGELLIIARENARKNAKKNEYGYHFTYLPLCNLRDIVLGDDPDYRDVKSCVIKLANSEFPLSYLCGNTQAMRFYESLHALFS